MGKVRQISPKKAIIIEIEKIEIQKVSRFGLGGNWFHSQIKPRIEPTPTKTPIHAIIEAIGRLHNLQHMILA